MFPVTDFDGLERYRIPAGGEVQLSQFDPKDRQGLAHASRDAAEAAMQADIAEIDRLQDILYAEARRALLVIFQGTDTAGKDGVIRKVFGPVDPLGLVATSFKRPSAQELAHDYLWRVHKAAPPAGHIGIFNRSQYEDVLVARVHNLVPPDVLAARYDQINAFEQHLAANNVVIVKFFLHISKDEQKERLQARLDEPAKRWKFNPGDLEERKRWDDYVAAYEAALARCSTAWAPWFVVPANRKWYRNAVVARIVRQTLEAMRPTYPPDPPGLDQIRID